MLFSYRSGYSKIKFQSIDEKKVFATGFDPWLFLWHTLSKSIRRASFFEIDPWFSVSG